MLRESMMAPLPPRRHRGGPEALTEQIARALQVRGWRVEQLLWGERSLTAQAAIVLRTMKRLGHDEAAAHFLAPLDIATLESAPEHLTPDLFIEEQHADNAEQLAEVSLLVKRSPETLRAYLRAVERNLGALRRMQAALMSELDRR